MYDNPNYGNAPIPTMYDSFKEGFDIVNAPKRMRQEDEERNLQLELLRNKANYAPQFSEAKLQGYNLDNSGKTIANTYAPKYNNAQLLGMNLNNNYQSMQNNAFGRTNQLQNALLQAQINKTNRPEASQYKPTIVAQLLQEQKLYKPGSPQWNTYQAAITKETTSSNGIQIGSDENGNPIVSIGGTGGGKGGQMYMDQNGNVYQMPTTAEQTKLQKSIIGSENIKPEMETIIKTLPQFQSGWNQGLNKAEGFMNKWLGTNYKMPSEKAVGEAALQKATERLVSNLQINATGENMHRVYEIITPKEGESPKWYKKRAEQQLADFMEDERRAQAQSRGIPISVNNSPQASADPMSQDMDKIRNTIKNLRKK